MGKKKRFHRAAKRFHTIQDWTKFHDIRNLYNLNIKEAKINCEKARAEKLQNSENLSFKKWLRLAKLFLKNDPGHSLYPALKVDKASIF